MNSFETMPLRFRVWDKEKQRWYCPTGTYGSERFHYDVLSKLWRIEFWAEDDGPEKYIISQDTGLKDKNGKSIYSGDVVKAFSNINKISDPELAPDTEPLYANKVVEFINGAFCLSTKRYPHGGCGVLDHYCGAMSADLEVIGNIWQNPELLEEK